MFLNIFLLAPSIYMLQIYDRVMVSQSVETLLMLTLVLVLIFLFLYLIENLRAKILLRASNRFDNILKQDTFQALFEYSLKDPSNINHKPLIDLSQLRQFIINPAFSALFDLPWALLYIGLLFGFHLWYGIFAFISLVILIIIVYFKERRTKELQEQLKVLNYTDSIKTQNFIENSEIIHSMGMQKNINTLYDEIYHKWLEVHTNTSDRSTTWSTTTKYLRMLLQSLILGLGAYLAINMEITSGMIIAGSLILGRVLAPIDVLTAQWKYVILARDSYKNLKTFYENLEQNDIRVELPSPTGNIKIENLIVIPPKSDVAVLKYINLEFKSSTIISIIGESASGKSSLIRTILGIWPANNGRVMYDGAQIEQWNRDQLGKFIGYLPQDIELFDGTIAQNIARMGKDVDSQKVINSAKLCDAHEMIVSMKDGYNTQIGPKGVILSGGQRQRIALARAIYGEPKIVVLDEPNSNLDDKGDIALIKTMQRLKSAGTTIILVTHKPNILQYTDEIVVLKDATVAQHIPTKQFIQQLQKSIHANR